MCSGTGHAETHTPAGEGLAWERAPRGPVRSERLPEAQGSLTARPAWSLEQTRLTLQNSYSHPGPQPKEPRGVLAPRGAFNAEKPNGNCWVRE